MRVKKYLHSSKENNLDLAKKIGLDDEAAENFMYALYEVEFELEVDMETGDYEIVSVDGVKMP